MSHIYWVAYCWADHLADTGTLSLREHGAYCTLIAHYYVTRRPIPADAMRTHCLCRCADDTDRAAVDFVLREFFILEGDVYHHKRIDFELARILAKSSQAHHAALSRWQKNGKKSPGGGPADAHADASADAHADASADAMRIRTRSKSLPNPSPGGKDCERKNRNSKPASEPPALPALRAQMQETLDRIPTDAPAYQGAIADALRAKGWALRTEAPIEYDGHAGRLNILVTQPAVIGIEIGRLKPRRRSLDKLRCVDGYRFVVLRAGVPNGPIEGIDAVLAPTINGHGQRAFTGRDWWKSVDGIQAKGEALGLRAQRGESAEHFKLRILARQEIPVGGDERRTRAAPHLERLRQTVRRAK